MWSTSWPRSRAACTSAQPAATASTQPVSPQRQGSPSAEPVLVCPISPAAPAAPRSSWPPVTMPTPMPVDAFTKSRSRCCSRWPRRSDNAITLASLSTKTGCPAAGQVRRNGASSTPSQPRHDRRVQAGPAREVHGAGDRQPDRAYVVRGAAGLVEQGPERRRPPAASGRAPTARPPGPGQRGQHRPVEVADAELGAAAPDRPGEHDAGVAVEAELHRGAAAGRG